MNDELHQIAHPLQISTVTRPAAELLINWRYPPPYDIYNMFSDDPEDIADTIDYLLDPVNNFYLLAQPTGNCVGFCSFGSDAQVPGGNYEQAALDIGMGIRPDLTGQGLGTRFAQTVIQFGLELFQPDLLRVTIASFNKRAQRVWQRNGFQFVQTFESDGAKRPFTIFTRKV